MTMEYTEEPNSGYFNCWSGRYPTACVQTLDLYMAWRDGEKFPPLAAFENLCALIVPGEMLTGARVAEVARSRITSLEITMHEGPAPPDGVFELPGLEELEMSGCGLTALPDRFDRLPRLTRLVVNFNDLVALPPSVLRSPSLRSLSLEFNRLTKTPAFAGDSGIQQLELTANPLAVLDVSLLPRGLTVLKAMVDLEEVSDDIAALGQLQVLALGKKLRGLPDLRGLERLVEVQLAGKLGEALFERLPGSLERLSGCGSHCVGLERIPPSIGRLSRLRALELPFEKITTLAAELRGVPLEQLGLSSTQLADTPSYVHLPGTLRSLALANVGMTRCPDRIAELVLLQKLVLTANRLTEIPAAVRGLPLLTELEVRSQRV